jgi:hypothetical protein
VPTVGPDLFFNALLQPGAGLRHDELGVLVAERTEASVAVERFAQNGEFFRANVAGEVLARLPDLEFEVGAGLGGATGRTILTEFAQLHGLDLGDLGQDLSGSGRIGFHKSLAH